MTRAKPHGKSLRELTLARPAFQPTKIRIRRWLNPESPGAMIFRRVSLPAITMHILALREATS